MYPFAISQVEIQFLQQERELEDGKLVTYKEGRYRKEYKRELVNEKHIALWQYRSSVNSPAVGMTSSSRRQESF